jgi:hypothetical protein
MSMYKAAQLMVDDMTVSLPSYGNEDHNNSDDIVFYEEKPIDAAHVVEMHPPDDATMQISFDLPFLPGADDLVEVMGNDHLEVEMKGDKEDKDEKEKDKSKASDQPKDLNWIKEYLNKIPKHKGENLGCERAKSYLNRGLSMLSKMLQDDHEGKIDISHAEDARISMESGIERLEKELAGRKKKANSKSELTKEAQKIAGVGGIIVTVPILISRIARTCINGSISGGKDIEDLFHRQADKWKLTDREKVEVIQLIQDMGYPLPRLDRGFMVDDKEPYERSSEKNFDYPPNYNA